MSSAIRRAAAAADLARLAAIEDAADARFSELFGPDLGPPAATGDARAAMGGFILVVVEAEHAACVGFVHVLEADGAAHLEQLAVLPAHGRRGHGRALVHAALTEAAQRGYREVTLRTYADVPWNAPFYATCGFLESEPDTSFLRGLQDVETRLGLEQYGRRIQMTAAISARG